MELSCGREYTWTARIVVSCPARAEINGNNLQQ
jgi:hypothetical protein